MAKIARVAMSAGGGGCGAGARRSVWLAANSASGAAGGLGNRSGRQRNQKKRALLSFWHQLCLAAAKKKENISGYSSKAKYRENSSPQTIRKRSTANMALGCHPRKYHGG
jgi:hypothetical protein